MKFPQLSSAALAAALLGASAIGPAIAQDSDERTATGSDSGAEPNPFYNSFKIQQIESDFDNLDEAFNFGTVVAGFRLPGDLKWLGVEIELSQTVIPGENQGPPPTTTTGGGGGGGLIPGTGGGGGGSSSQASGNFTNDNDDLRILAGGINLVARSTGQYYVGAKVGYSQLFQSSIDEIDGESDFGFGVLAGLRFGNSVDSSSVELDYSQLAGDLDALSVNFITRFGN